MTKTRKYEPWVIPGYGCASFNDRGIVCSGDNTIDKNKYCYKCMGYNSDKKIKIQIRT